MSSKPIVIRPERPDHQQVRLLLSQLDAYLATLYSTDENHILDEHALRAPDVSFIVAEREGRIVGCGAVRRMPGDGEASQQPYGEIKRMIVEPAQRGQGVGARVIEALESVLRSHGVGLALLETGALQREAVRLYERCGYRRREAFGGYPDNGLSLFYEKALSR
jgi:putative acetyltransferase